MKQEMKNKITYYCLTIRLQTFFTNLRAKKKKKNSRHESIN